MPVDKKQIWLAKNAGKTNAEIASEFGISESGVRARLSEYNGALRIYKTHNPDTPPFKTTVRGEDYEFNLRRFNAGEPVYNDSTLVTGDWHLPLTNWHMVRLLVAFARRHNVTSLEVIGDFLNFDILSVYDQIFPSVSMVAELELAGQTLEYLLEQFKTIHLRMGNHDLRIFKRLHGDFTASLLGRILAGKHIASERISVGVQTQLEIISNGTRWRTTHPRNYAKAKGVVVSRLAQKYQCNIIGFHEHHVSVMRDTYNRYTVVNGGGLFDAEKMAYVNHEDSDSSVMNNGFTYLKNGTAHLLTPYETMTDWNLWGVGNEAVEAIVHARESTDRMLSNELRVLN